MGAPPGSGWPPCSTHTVVEFSGLTPAQKSLLESTGVLLSGAAREKLTPRIVIDSGKALRPQAESFDSKESAVSKSLQGGRPALSPQTMGPSDAPSRRSA